MNTVGRFLNATDYYGSLLYGTGMWFEGKLPSWIVQVRLHVRLERQTFF